MAKKSQLMLLTLSSRNKSQSPDTCTTAYKKSSYGLSNATFQCNNARFRISLHRVVLRNAFLAQQVSNLKKNNVLIPFSSTSAVSKQSIRRVQSVLTDKISSDNVPLPEPDDESEKESEATGSQESRTESFVAAVEEGENRVKELLDQICRKEKQIASLQIDIDKLYQTTFAGVEVHTNSSTDSNVEPTFCYEAINEQLWAELGRSNSSKLKSLIDATAPKQWQDFQRNIHGLSLTRNRYRQELNSLQQQLEEVNLILTPPDIMTSEDEREEQDDSIKKISLKNGVSEKIARIVLISGFESFNVALYKKAAAEIKLRCPGVRVAVFSDRDIDSKRDKVEAELARADVLFCSLLFDYDQCEWVKERVKHIPIRLVFESSLELMATTSLGSFVMAGGKSKGMPAPVKAVLSKFGGGREEDKMVGYLSFLKIGPKLLRFVPGQKARDLRNWLTVYGYWNQGGLENVVSMFLYLADEYLVKTGLPPRILQETPALGLYHPDYDGYFTNPKEYLKWSIQTRNLPKDAPVVATLLYRKHVITQQKYVPQMIRMFEKAGLRPLPIFINGVEAHTVVRDLLTTSFEQNERKKGNLAMSSLSRDAVMVDAVVSTIGFPLVGGPAGTMEGGRQAEIAKSILLAKNVPYFVSGPLLIQDITSWKRDGIQGLQSVVLYSLPELDGAIDAVPLGGLVGDGIHLVPERVRRLTSRVKSWVKLRRTPPSERKVAIVLYGFPPGVGATGTAALLNVPKSLEKLLLRLKSEGYDLGDYKDKIDGEDVVKLLTALDSDFILNKGKEGPILATETLKNELKEEGRDFPPGQAMAETIDWRTLRDWLGEILTTKMEKAWGDLNKYRGIHSDADGNSVVNGVWLGNVWIGVQPLLGLEGDPMRLLFERDLTPHPQYAAFYKWLQRGMEADAVVHMGMHGTVEWLPGVPLGNSGLSWSDVLMGNIPNLYIYAANNPSESIVAKRRGYGTIISYNVPPYGRAGLYKELSSLRELISEYKEDPQKNDGLREVIVGNLVTSGLYMDCPFQEETESQKVLYLTDENFRAVESSEFEAYMGKLYEYLAVVENRLFSEGLHTLGAEPSPSQMEQYLSAYFGEEMSAREVEVVATSPGGLEEVRSRLEQLYWKDGNSKMQEENLSKKIDEAVEIRNLLKLNTEEVDSIIKALNGEYIPPAVGGDLLRDGPGVLPTGRNIHALDPYRMPSPAAWERGCQLAENIIKQHFKENGAYPETVAIMLWGLDAIKTRGESLAIALALVGAYPQKEGTGRVVRFELKPLEELGGRPRIDILANMSGIFRDSFANVVDLLDDLFRRASSADEPIEMNYIRKHSLELEAEGVEIPTARIFSNPAGDYGSMVNERIGAADWENSSELGDTWQSRNAFSYGRGERGVARPEVLQKLLQSTDRIVQEIDSVEYGLTDIQEYYANTGALKNAAETSRKGKKVSCSVVETYGKDLNPRDLEATLRLEYRSKLLNPKWAEKMSDSGSGGAYEISQRMTALLGWGGTCDFKENWVYKQAAETYALDEIMAAKLRKNNPQAFQNIVKRMLEAAGRGFWETDEETLSRLRDLYAEMDNELEGVKV